MREGLGEESSMRAERHDLRHRYHLAAVLVVAAAENRPALNS
jgi:hypothetical protein